MNNTKGNIRKVGVGQLTMEYDTQRGMLSCAADRQDVFRNACLAYVDGDGTVHKASDPACKHSASSKLIDTPWGEVEALETVAQADGLPTLKWTAYLIPGESAVAFGAQIDNKSDEDLYIREIYVLLLNAEDGGVLCGPSDSTFFGAPFNKSHPLPFPGDVGPRKATPNWTRCWWMLAMTDKAEGGRGLVAGVLECANVEVAAITRSAPGGDGLDLILSGGCYIDPWKDETYLSDDPSYHAYRGPDLGRRPLRIRPENSFTMTTTIVLWDEDVFRCLDRYADAVKKFNHIELPPKPTAGIAAWSADDDEDNSYCANAGEKELTKMMDDLDQMDLAKYGMNYFYYVNFSLPASPNLFEPYAFNDYGEWEYAMEPGRGYKVEKYFPRGIKAFVDEARSRGFKIGASTSPFVYDRVGSVDENQQAEETFRKFKEWGMEFIEMDFHNFFRENPCWERTGIEVLRDRYRAVRKAMGPDALLEACGAPFGAVLGLADTFRPALDAVPGREKLLHPGFKALYFLNGKCFWMHNEHLDVSEMPYFFGGSHSTRTADGQTREAVPRVKYSFEHVRSLWSFRSILCHHAAAGGNFAKFATPERVDLYRKGIPVYPGTARPVDLFERDLPKIYDLVVEKPFGNWHVVGLFNEDRDNTDVIEVDLKRIGLGGRKALVFDFWNQAFLGIKEGRFQVRVGPWACRILGIHEDSQEPMVLSTDRHITQGGVELEALRWDVGKMVLEGTSTGPKETDHHLFVYVPAAFVSGEATGAQRISWSPPILKIRVEFAAGENCPWNVRFDKVQ